MKEQVYGPYENHLGRKHVIVVTRDGGKIVKRKTISYPKYLHEKVTGQRLAPNQTIDHRDRDFRNDNVENFSVLDKSTHSKLDAVRVIYEDAVCPLCKITFAPTKDQATRRSVQKAGPFCSKRCAGLYGSIVQNGGSKLPRVDPERTYYQLGKI